MRNEPGGVTDARTELIERMRASAAEHDQLAEYEDSIRALERMSVEQALWTIAEWAERSRYTRDEARLLAHLIRNGREARVTDRGVLCETCGRLFLAKRDHARFCSNACRQAAYRARRNGSD
jgi:hypothetical protein